ncbi:MAG: TIGR02206 family membrane protein [Candidatus Marinimicrobia bacterium]|nr:TIGR02206 family membrane protein [Candidatus Neomarinimicrobiota bacterium]
MIPHQTIPLFGSLWWQSNIATLISIILILIWGKRNSWKQNRVLSYAIGVVLLLRYFWAEWYTIDINLWTIQSSLPLQMCGIAAILSGIVPFWRNQTAYEFLYFWGIPGALHSVITPEFTIGTEGPLFIEYYISHGGIIISALFLTLFLGMRPRQGSWWKIFLWTQPILLIIGLINYVLDANYMYLCVPPDVNNPFVIGRFPLHLIFLELAGILHFFIVYIPFGIKYRKQKIMLEDLHGS